MASTNDKTFESILLNIAKKLYHPSPLGRSGGASILDMPLLKATATQLREAITIGYKTPDNKDFDTKDYEMLRSLEKNVYVFSGFKTYQQLRSITDKLKDENGNVRSFSDFKKEVLNINEKYNVNYLKAEYDNALVSSQMASQWQDIQRNIDVLPYLEFDATMDNRTTAICQSLNGVTLPADDPFWNEYYLPLHWHERSVIRQIARGKVTDKSTIITPDLQPMFKNNVGKTGVAFPESHPYYDTSKAIAKQINKAVDKMYINPDDYKEVAKGVWLHANHNPLEIKDNTKVAKLIAGNNHEVKLLPYSYEKGIKNPDASIDNKIADFKGIHENTHSAVQHAIQHAGKQTAEIAVLTLPKNISNQDVVRAMYGALSNPEWNKHIKSVWFIKNKKLIKVDRKEIINRTFKGL